MLLELCQVLAKVLESLIPSHRKDRLFTSRSIDLLCGLTTESGCSIGQANGTRGLLRIAGTLLLLQHLLPLLNFEVYLHRLRWKLDTSPFYLEGVVWLDYGRASQRHLHRHLLGLLLNSLLVRFAGHLSGLDLGVGRFNVRRSSGGGKVRAIDHGYTGYATCAGHVGPIGLVAVDI